MLDIYYRLCEQRDGTHCGNNRPEWFSKESCLYSFLNAVDNAEEYINSVTFIFDGPTGKLFDLIQDHDWIRIDKGNYYGSLEYTYQSAQSSNNDLYFVEDDYLHLPESIKKIALAIPKFNLLSPYDHLARYDPVKYTGKQDSHYDLQITFDEVSNHHWRTNESSCHTYAISNKTFRTHYNTITNSSCISHDQNLFRAMYLNGYPLWTPITALATQVDPYMSPGVKWEQLNKIFAHV